MTRASASHLIDEFGWRERLRISQHSCDGTERPTGTGRSTAVEADKGLAAALDIDGQRVAIARGMAVNGQIITGDRRGIEFVLSPLLRYRHESGRER